MANIFDTLLTTIAEADRTAFSELAERNPAIKEYIADPAAIKQVDAVTQWTANNWDFEHACTKQEFARQQKIDALEAQIAAMPAAGSGEAMNLDELNKFLDEKIASGAVVSAKTVKDEVAGIVGKKEEEFNSYMLAMARTATVVPYLNQLHQINFGELFKPEDLLNKANEAKATDLEEFYHKTYAAEKFAAKAKVDSEKAAADLAAQLAAAKEEGRKAALQEQVGQTQQTPGVDGGADMAAFQTRLQATRESILGPGKALVAPNAELGTGQIAAAAARAGDLAEMAGRAA